MKALGTRETSERNRLQPDGSRLQARDRGFCHGAVTFGRASCGAPFEIDDVTSDTDVYGITIYGSGAGPNTVKSSHFSGSSAWVDFQGFDQGHISFDTIYTNGNEVLKGTPPPSINGKVAAPIADAKPR
jgi:hypothetical protein